MITEKQWRLMIANQMIKIISDHGRRFFYNKNDATIAYFIIKKGRIFFVDDYSKKEIYLHYKYWDKGFSHGGTMRSLIQELKNYIQGKRPLPIEHLGPWRKEICGGDLWGYGKDMNLVREKCIDLQ